MQKQTSCNQPGGVLQKRKGNSIYKFYFRFVFKKQTLGFARNLSPSFQTITSRSKIIKCIFTLINRVLLPITLHIVGKATVTGTIFGLAAISCYVSLCYLQNTMLRKYRIGYTNLIVS